jgi:hypothetical protein
MTRKTNLDGLDSAPRWIFLLLGSYLILDLFALYIWNAAGQAFSLQGMSGNTSALSVTGIAAVELWLCLVVLRSFPAGAPLRSAWILITLAAAVRAASGVLAQLLGTDWPLNPLVWSGHAKSAMIGQVWRLALIAGGPVRLALLAAGILAVLRCLRKFGFWVRPSATDWAMSGIVGVFTLCRFGEACAAFLAGNQIRLEDWIPVAGDLILCALFLEAMLLRHSVVRMGNGLISKCWAALMCGIFLTGVGEVALWVIPHYSHAWPLAAIEALTQFSTAAAFALAPAYQVAALCMATRQANSRPEHPATHPARPVPALAR